VLRRRYECAARRKGCGGRASRLYARFPQNVASRLRQAPRSQQAEEKQGSHDAGSPMSLACEAASAKLPKPDYSTVIGELVLRHCGLHLVLHLAAFVAEACGVNKREQVMFDFPIFPIPTLPLLDSVPNAAHVSFVHCAVCIIHAWPGSYPNHRVGARFHRAHRGRRWEE